MQEGRLLNEINLRIPSLLQNASTAELEELRKDLDVIIQKKKFRIVDIKSQISAISSSYSAIDFAENSNDAQTLSAVTLVDLLDFKPVVDEILRLENGTTKWEFAVELSKVLSRILFNAEGYADKYVNGEKGSFCPRTASLVLNMWTKIVADTTEGTIDPKVFEKAAGLHPYCLGSYGDLSFIAASSSRSKI